MDQYWSADKKKSKLRKQNFNPEKLSGNHKTNKELNKLPDIKRLLKNTTKLELFFIKLDKFLRILSKEKDSLRLVLIPPLT